jgi:hypothetical protein
VITRALSNGKVALPGGPSPATTDGAGKAAVPTAKAAVPAQAKPPAPEAQ